MKDELLGFVVGPIQTNCYAYCSEGHCLVVDAGFRVQRLLSVLPMCK